MIGALLTPLPGLAEVSESLNYRFYEVHVRPGDRLGQALTAASPIRYQGRIYRGYTSWRVQWRFRWYQNADGSCRVTSVVTEASGEITLPRLNDAAPASHRQAFTPFVAALKTHELGHFAFAQDAAKTIDQGIASLPTMKSCAQLEQRANDLGHEVLRQATAAEKAYDRHTDHGRTQGAWLSE